MYKKGGTQKHVDKEPVLSPMKNKNKTNDVLPVNTHHIYSELGILLITVTLLTLIIPIIAVWVVQQSKFKTNE